MLMYNTNSLVTFGKPKMQRPYHVVLNVSNWSINATKSILLDEPNRVSYFISKKMLRLSNKFKLSSRW